MADWLAHATQEHTHRLHTGWYSMYRIQQKEPSTEALELPPSPAPFPPRALPPGHDILSETIPSDYSIAMFELWFFPERGGFYLYGF